MLPRIKYTHKINCRRAYSVNRKVDLRFLNRNFDINFFIEIFEFSLPEINKIMKKLVILQLDNDPKHRSLKALEYYKEDNIKILII